MSPNVKDFPLLNKHLRQFHSEAILVLYYREFGCIIARLLIVRWAEIVNAS